MNFTRTEHTFTSSNKTDRITYYIFTPPVKAKALVQICHGMCEHSGRYEEFIDYLCGRGYAVIIHDHLGHGKSAADMNDLGYFALDKGWIYLIKDLRHLQIIGRQMFGMIPHFFIGHSMGSLVVRCLLSRHSPDTDGAVLLGTAGRFPVLDGAMLMAEREIMLHGVRSRPANMNKIFFAYCNSCIDDKRTDFDWLTRDEAEVDKYMADKRCSFTFTASAFKDLFMLIECCTRRSWYKKVRPDIPLLIMSGDEDPVGMFGKGVMSFYRELERKGFSNAEIKLWDGCRHELLHEYDKSSVFEEIADWLDKQV